MLNGRANDIKKHKWFEGLDWEALEARKVTPLRKPKEDSAKRLKELTVRSPAAHMLSMLACLPVFQIPSSIIDKYNNSNAFQLMMSQVHAGQVCLSRAACLVHPYQAY